MYLLGWIRSYTWR